MERNCKNCGNNNWRNPGREPYPAICFECVYIEEDGQKVPSKWKPDTMTAADRITDNLKPCPFCGCLPEFRTNKGNRRIKDTRTVLRCTNPQCYLHFNGPTSWHCGDTEEHAKQRLTTWWNRRAGNADH